MGDRWVIALALATGLGAWAAFPFPAPVALAIALVALAGRWPVVLCLAAALLASSRSAGEWERLDSPLPDSVGAATATLTSDPVVSRSAVIAEAEVHERLFRISATGDAAGVLRSLSSGERVELSGSVAPLNGRAAPHLRRRHVAGRLHVDAIRRVDAGSKLQQAANVVRGRLQEGARSMRDDDRALFTGLLIGDDREQSRHVAAEFRAAGLAHLLAVSGSNVAFVLLAVRPLLSRFGLTGRLAGGLAVLVLFGTVTRWEPSVVRAEAMAAVTLLGAFLGRPISAWRGLGLGVTVILLVDPFLVGSVAFLLSAGACAGMAAFGGAMSDRLPGPLFVRQAVGYTLAAQVGVAPVHLVVFGPMPVVAVITNLLAEPAAGAVMIWGLGAGLVAGIVGEPFATVLHWPTVVLVRWIAALAHFGAIAPLGGWSGWWLAAAGSVFALKWRRHGRSLSRDYVRDDDPSPARLPREG